jgi:hypothetical protein
VDDDVAGIICQALTDGYVTAMMEAAAAGHVAAIVQLVRCRADINLEVGRCRLIP